MGERERNETSCSYCSERAAYVCMRCHGCEHCCSCRTPAGEVTLSGVVHRLSFKGTELRAVIEDHLARGLPRKPGQKPAT